MNTDIQQLLSQLLSQHRNATAQYIESSVAAVVTIEDDTRYFEQTITALLQQTVLPQCLIIADCTGQTAQVVRTQVAVESIRENIITGSSIEKQNIDVQVVRAKGSKSFGDAIARALAYAKIPSGVRFIWALHDDSRPANAHCLEALLEARNNAPTTAIFGAKQFDWDAQVLHEVGGYAYKHEIASLVVDGEEDQEQYDNRTDVYYVSLAGALISLEVFKKLKGCNSWFGTFGESQDFCRRICKSGGRVVVVPQAHIAHRRARYEGVRKIDGSAVADESNPVNYYLHTTLATLRFRYTDISPLWWILLWPLSAIYSLYRVVHCLLNKQPYEAWCELCLPWIMLMNIPRALAATTRIGLQSAVSASDLSVLYADSNQIKRWKDRQKAFLQQSSSVILNS
ncbi:MAG: glycosyl transferase family 2, partial [Bifidobacteriaceae bacterium]|nr:glycosyl transferase family 2 [Bifidobacteriaceae bacterium]